MTHQEQITNEVQAKPIWKTIHPTVRQVMSELNITAVNGTITGFYVPPKAADSLNRMELTFTYNNNADVCNHKLWFDVNQIDVRYCA